MIGTTVDKIAAITRTINATVERQAVTTGEITDVIDQSARSTEEIFQGMTTLKAAAEETGTVAGHVRTASERLSQQAVELKSEVRQFLDSVRAA